MKNNTVILFSGDNFKALLDPFDDFTDCIINQYEHHGTIKTFFYKVLRGLKIMQEIDHKILWNSAWVKRIDKIENFIFFTGMNIGDVQKMSDFIKMKNPNARQFFYGWDIRIEIFNDTYPNGICGTFDQTIALQRNIKCWGQFYNSAIAEKSLRNPCTPIMDYMFIGQDKGRRSTVENLEKELKAAGLKGQIEIGDSFSIPYMEYLEQVKKSRAIIDILQQGQTGMTLRSLEALFFGKKLITNNIYLKDCDFYNENNIFIIGHDKRNLKEFFDADYCEVAEEVKNKYTIENLVKRITEKK